MAKKKRATNRRSISVQEESFIQDILIGTDLLEAYRRHWINAYDDAKARFYAKDIMARPHVRERMDQLLLERKSDVVLDEKFVIDHLKRIVTSKAGTGQAVKALELLGKNMAMWVDRQIVDDNAQQKDIAKQMWERRLKIIRGEEVEPLEEAISNGEAEILEFELKTGTDE